MPQIKYLYVSISISGKFNFHKSDEAWQQLIWIPVTTGFIAGAFLFVLGKILHHYGSSYIVNLKGVLALKDFVEGLVESKIFYNFTV